MMKNMQLSEAEQKEKVEESLSTKAPKYPYGLRIHIDSESFAKLGLEEPPKLGSKLALHGVVKVVNVSDEEGRGDEDGYSMSLQITAMGLDEVKEEKEVAKTEDLFYGAKSES